MPIFRKGKLRPCEKNYCLIDKILWCAGKVIFEHETDLQDPMNLTLYVLWVLFLDIIK